MHRRKTSWTKPEVSALRSRAAANGRRTFDEHHRLAGSRQLEAPAESPLGPPPITTASAVCTLSLLFHGNAGADISRVVLADSRESPIMECPD